MPMGPAARLTDGGMHGGIIVGPGAPMVLIGNLPAARVTDNHVCPMVTGVVPHVGGPIILGSFGVITMNLPQARLMDPMVCVGPPDMIRPPCCPTVIVGEIMPGAPVTPSVVVLVPSVKALGSVLSKGLKSAGLIGKLAKAARLFKNVKAVAKAGKSVSHSVRATLSKPGIVQKALQKLGLSSPAAKWISKWGTSVAAAAATAWKNRDLFLSREPANIANGLARVGYTGAKAVGKTILGSAAGTGLAVKLGAIGLALGPVGAAVGAATGYLLGAYVIPQVAEYALDSAVAGEKLSVGGALDSLNPLSSKTSKRATKAQENVGSAAGRLFTPKSDRGPPVC